MVTSPHNLMKHSHRLSTGRNFSFNVDSDEEIPLSESFVHLTKTTQHSEDRLKQLVLKSLQGLRSGFSPTLCESGVGGTYFMHDESNKTIGVFKPHDEEMGCLNNPKGFTPKTPSFKEYNVCRGAEAGEAAFRECAAYILDHEHFSGVPATGLVVCSHPAFSSTGSLTDNFKIGSFQEFKEHDFDAEDIGSTKYQQFPVHEVHKIAILDIRLLNTDRHGGNILVKANRSRTSSREDVLSDDYDSQEETRTRRRFSDPDERGMMFHMDMDVEDDDDDDDDYCYGRKDQCFTPQSPNITLAYELIPIDHGYTLPATISGLSDLWFEWLKWPQAKIPFGPEAQQYIDRLNPDEDIAILKQKFGDLINSDCFKVLRLTTMWLKIASKAGLTPHAIGYALCKKGGESGSLLERVSSEAEQTARSLSLPSHPLDLSCSVSPSISPNLPSDLSDLVSAQQAQDNAYFAALAQVMEREANVLASASAAPARAQFPRK